MARQVDDLPTTHDECANLLGKRDEMRLSGNTWLGRRRGDAYAIKLHGTDVVTFHPSGYIAFATGGWRTVTTKRRLNVVARAHGYRVFQRDFAWYLGSFIWGEESNDRDFHEGIEIKASSVHYDGDAWVRRATA